MTNLCFYNQGRQVTGGLFLEWGPVPNHREAEMADTIRTNWAVAKLKEKHEAPFFLGLGLYTPHFGKHTLWERTSNVPFIWAGPGIAKGDKTEATVSLIDMYPTFVRMCGLPNPRQKLEGKSIAEVLADPSEPNDRNVFLPHMEPGAYAIINRNWRYIHYADETEEL